MKPSRNTFSERSLHGRIAHDLGKKIVSGHYKPGEILPNETTICRDLEVSRTAVREAFKVLTAKGLLESRPKVGTRVKDRDQWNMLDPDVLAWNLIPTPNPQLLLSMLELRNIYSPKAAGLAALRADKEQRLAIEETLTRLKDHMDEPEIATEHELTFHLNIHRASGNEFITTLGALIETALSDAASFETWMPRQKDRMIPLYEAVAQSISEGNSESAETNMQRLLSNISGLTGSQAIGRAISS